jgi:hemolysin III
MTTGEQIANSITHGIGAALGIAALVVLVVMAARRGDPWRIVAFSVYGVSLVLLYLASTLYHALTPPAAKRVFEVLDHSAIFLLIAGTYTPFLLVTLRGPWGWSLFGVVWACAIVGIVFKAVFLGKWKKISTLIYVAMGWFVVIALKPLVSAMPHAGLAWLAAGGLAYTIGVVFYVWKSAKFAHAVWHLFVLAGSVCHFFAILLYIARS